MVDKEQVREHVNKLDTHKSTGPYGLHSQVLRKLAGITERPLSIIFERLWQLGNVPEDWRRANATPVFMKGKNEDLENYRLVSLISVPGKTVEQLILGTISRHVKDKKVIRSSQHGMMKGKLHLTNPIVCYKDLTSLVGEGRGVDAVYCNFSKAFATVSDNNLIV